MYEPRNPVCLYLTNEQAARISAICLDSLVGCQVHGDASDETTVYLDMVSIDDPHGSTRHFAVHADGSFAETT